MATTPNRGYYYPKSTDYVSAFPTPQQSSLMKIDEDMELALSAASSPNILGTGPLPYILPGGWHQMPYGADVVTEANGYPPDENRGYVLALAGDDMGKTARWYFGSYTGRIWTQEKYGSSAEWGPWRLVGPTGGSGGGNAIGADGPHRKTEMILRHGGQIGTAGRGVIALRFDHQNPEFQATILPMLKARGLPYTHAQYALALSPVQENGYPGDEQTGMSWSQVQKNSINQGGEVFSHSYSHGDTTDYHREVVESKQYLEEQMPEVKIDGFAQPGISGNAWDGFATNLDNPAQWRDYAAGRLIRDTYGLYTGSGPLYNPLAGIGADGITYTAIDGVSSATSSKNIVDAVIALKYGAVLMMHPNVIGDSGKISVSTLEEILDYIVTKRDAGDLVVLTLSGMSAATAHHSERSNLLEATKFDPFSRWLNTTGWTASDGVASTETGSPIARPWSYDSTRWARGGAREASAEFRAPQGATVSVRVVDTNRPTILDSTRTVTLPASGEWVTVRQPFLIPANSTIVRYEAGRVSGGLVEMRNPGLFAI